MKLVVALFAALAMPGAAHAADAANRGPIVLTQVPEVCTQIYQPVCGTDPAGKRVTYSNDCFARVAKATNVTPGECPK
jgi:hypothetical protein